MLIRKTVILAKIESTYGVDPVPTVGANALLVKDVEIKPAGETITRDFLRSSLSPLTHRRGIKHQTVSFVTELKGAGTPGALPAWGWEGVLLRACGLQETINAGVSIAYAPRSSSFESCTLYVYRDGIFHKLVGCRGTVSFTLEVGKIPTAKFEMSGLYVSPVDGTPSAQSFSTVEPATVLAAGFTCGGYAAVAEKLEISLNNSLAQRKSINSPTGILEWIITGRDPNGSFDPETVTEATEDFWAKWEAAESMELAIGPIGSTSGNIVSLSAPAMQYREINYADRNGLLAYQIPFGLAGNNGDDELVITFS